MWKTIYSRMESYGRLFPKRSAGDVRIIMSGKPKPTINEVAMKYVKDVLCYLPLGLLVEYAKIRPVQHAGALNLKLMIATAGYDQNSVIKVRAPADRIHIHWGIEYLKRQSSDGKATDKDGWEEMLGGLVLKKPADRTAEDLAFLYGVVDGAHRVGALSLLVDDPEYPQYTLHYLVPCQVLVFDMPEELSIALATSE